MSRKEEEKLEDAVYDEAFTRMMAETNFFDDEIYKKHVDEMNARFLRGGVGVLGKAPRTPDVPACDACGKAFSGKSKCSRCKSVFYCSKECQKAHWKHGGHKSSCDAMKEECEKAGAIVVSLLNDDTIPVYARLDHTQLSRLDGSGAYMAAVKEGLHESILALMETDRDELIERVRDERILCSSTQYIMSTLFRGNRVEGRGFKNTSFSCIDSSRIIGFVQSHPNAFDTWLEASIEAYKLPLDPVLSRFPDSELHVSVHRMARDVWAAWIMVWTNRSAAKAILMGASNNPKAAEVIFRAKSIGERFKSLLKVRWDAGDDRDPGSVIEGILNQICAMVGYWLNDFNIPVTFDPKYFEMKGQKKMMYSRVAVPFAEGTIAKGRNLTNKESQALLSGF